MKYKELFKKDKSSDCRETPDYLFSYWNKLFRFNLDVCANEENFKCTNYLTIKEDGLNSDWSDKNWCNPPYSSGQIIQWLVKGRAEQEKGNLTVFLLPCDTSTKWYSEIRENLKCSIIPIVGRVKFNGAKLNSPFGSHIVIFWPNKKTSNYIEV